MIARRWWIGGLLFASTVINYIDRQTLAVLAPYLKIDYHWNNEDFAKIVIAFRVAYALGQTFAGRFLDKAGTRNGLTVTVLWYSIAAMATSFASSLAGFCGFRLLWGWVNRPTGLARQRRCVSTSLRTSEPGRSRSSIADLRLARQSRRCWFCGCTSGLAVGAPSS